MCDLPFTAKRLCICTPDPNNISCYGHNLHCGVNVNGNKVPDYIILLEPLRGSRLVVVAEFKCNMKDKGILNDRKFVKEVCDKLDFYRSTIASCGQPLYILAVPMESPSEPLKCGDRVIKVARCGGKGGIWVSIPYPDSRLNFVCRGFLC